MAVIPTPLSDLDQVQRAASYRDIVASLRLEGMTLDAPAQALFDRYVRGDCTLAELGAAIDELNEREFGPVHLSGHPRS